MTRKVPRGRKGRLREYRGKCGTTCRVSCDDTQAKARRTIRTFHAEHLAEAFVNGYENFFLYRVSDIPGVIM